MLLLTALAASGCSRDDPERAAPPSSETAGGVDEESRQRAAALHVGLTVQLQVRTHLVVERAGAAATGDGTAVAAVAQVLQAQPAAVTGVLDDAGAVVGAPGLRAALAAEARLLSSQATATDLLGRLQVRARRPAVEQELASAVTEVSAGRLPSDVAAPLVAAHVGALLHVVDAARTGKGLPAALVSSLTATERLVTPLVLAVSVGLGLDRVLRGDAAALRSELASVLAHDGFAGAGVALGSRTSPAQGATALPRLVRVVRRLYGAEVAAHVGAAREELDREMRALLDALTDQALAVERGTAGTALEREVLAARAEVDLAAGDLASRLAGLVGEDALAPRVRALLLEHREALEALHADRGGAAASSWRDATEAAVRLSELGTLLAEAVARQKSLG